MSTKPIKNKPCCNCQRFKGNKCIALTDEGVKEAIKKGKCWAFTDDAGWYREYLRAVEEYRVTHEGGIANASCE